MESQTESPFVESAKAVMAIVAAHRPLNSRSWMNLKFVVYKSGRFDRACTRLDANERGKTATALRNRVREHIDSAKAVCQDCTAATSEDHLREMNADFEGIAFSLAEYLLDFNACLIEGIVENQDAEPTKTHRTTDEMKTIEQKGIGILAIIGSDPLKPIPKLFELAKELDITPSQLHRMKGLHRTLKGIKAMRIGKGPPKGFRDRNTREVVSFDDTE